MFKNIEVLDKEKFKGFKYDEVNPIDAAKNMGLVPLGFSEVWNAAHDCPVIISSLHRGEFLAFTGITSELNIYRNENSYIPALVRSYPFLSLDIKAQDGSFNTLISIDNNEEFVGKKKKLDIFTKEGELSQKVDEKVQFIREINRQRELSRKIIEELKENDLLIKKDFRVKINENEEKVFLEEFYIVNAEKISQLDDTVIASWAKKGWMGIIDSHIKSLANFQKVVQD